VKYQGLQRLKSSASTPYRWSSFCFCLWFFFFSTSGGLWIVGLDIERSLGRKYLEHAPSRYEYHPLTVDDLSQIFERDGALWSDNAYSDAVRYRTLL
jgi:hypothetical protein